MDILENKHLYNDCDYQAKEIKDLELKLKVTPNLYATDLPISEESEKASSIDNVEQKNLGRRFIATRNLPHSDKK